MRSTAYSVMMTLLLLVPISAVPLMAIFGVPQFTPVVSSPLDDIDEDDWDRPVRKKSRATAQSPSDEVEDVDEIAGDDTLDWNAAAEERPRSFRKRRPVARTKTKSPAVDVEESFAESPGFDDEPAPRASRNPPRRLDDEPASGNSEIQLVSNEIPEPESAFAESAEATDDKVSVADSPVKDAKISGFRRQKSASRQEADQSPAKPASNKKRTAPSTEPLSWQNLSQRLNDYGIRNFHLESLEQGGEFLFTCTYTPSNSPHVTRKFEAVADDPLKAVAKVLAQVEEASQQKVMASPRQITEAKKQSWAE